MSLQCRLLSGYGTTNAGYGTWSDAGVGIGMLRGLVVSGKLLRFKKIHKFKNPRRSTIWFSENTNNPRGSSKVRSYGWLVDTFSKICLIQWDLLMFSDLSKASKIWKYSKTYFGYCYKIRSETNTLFFVGGEHNKQQKYLGVQSMVSITFKFLDFRKFRYGKLIFT